MGEGNSSLVENNNYWSINDLRKEGCLRFLFVPLFLLDDPLSSFSFYNQVGEVVGSAGSEGTARQTNKTMYNGKVWFDG